MEFTYGQKGVQLAKEEKWDDAIEHLSKAIKVTKSPAWLLARAQAYQQKGELDKALVDCEHAYLAAAARQGANRNEQMKEAQYRRGVVCFKQGRYADADACFLWAMRLAMRHTAREPDLVPARVRPDGVYMITLADLEADKPSADEENDTGGQPKDLDSATKKKEWVRPHSFRLVNFKNLEKLPEDAPGRKLTVSRMPSPPPLDDGDSGKNEYKSAAKSAVAAAAAAPTPAAPPAEQKLRFDFFQNNKSVTLSVFIKGVDKTKFAVEPAGAKTLVLRNIPRESNPNAVLALDHEIVPADTKHTVGATKVELTLTKANPGQKWGSWGSEMTMSDAASLVAAAAGGGAPFGNASLPEPTGPSVDMGTDELVAAAAAADRPPAYPTSSKSGPKDWERLGQDGDDDQDQDVDSFFKKLYKNASPEAQRAMMKSYIESNGTELSTDWNNVKDRKVPVHPPDGAEVKKW